MISSIGSSPTRLGKITGSISVKFLPVFEGIGITPADAMSNQILDYAANGQSLQWMNNRYPAGGWQDMGASMQKYVVGELDAAGLAEAIENYWANLEE